MKSARNVNHGVKPSASLGRLAVLVGVAKLLDHLIELALLDGVAAARGPRSPAA
jgi:hypothetical protein